MLRVDVETHRDPYGAVRALSESLLHTAPDVAGKTVGPYFDLLRRVVPAIAERLDLPQSDEAVEERIRLQVQAAFQDWFVAIAKERPLVLAVDNVHAVDEFSGAVLAALARRSRKHALLTLFTRRTEAPVSAAAAVRGIYEASSSLKLRGLTREETGGLVLALFGDVPHADRFAEWLQEPTGGNPLKCIELARHLVAQNVVRYAQGTWSLPTSPSEIDLGSGFDAAQSERIAQLPARSRSLAQALSVFGPAVPMEVCVSIGELEGEKDVLSVLDDLVGDGVLIASGQHYRFEHEGLREALRGGLETDHRQRLHRHVATTMLASAGDGDLFARSEAGFHLLEAGDRDSAAELLAETGMALAANTDNLGVAAPALEAAVELYREAGRHDYTLLPLLAELAQAAYYVDRKFACHNDEAVRILKRATGIGLATRLRPMLGRHLSFAVGLTAGGIGYALTPKKDRTASFAECLVMLFTCAATRAGIFSTMLDHDATQEAATLLEPFSILGDKVAPTAVLEMTRGSWLMTQDRMPRAREHWLKVLPRLEDPARVKGVPERERRTFVGGALYSLGIIESFRDGTGALEYADRLDALDDKLYEMVADQLRMQYHAQRGELKQTEKYRERVDMHAIQKGSAWQVEIWSPLGLSAVYRRTGDSIALKRTVDHLERLHTEIPSLEQYVLNAQAAYEVARGNPQKAAEILEALLDGLEPRRRVGWLGATGLLAQAYNQLGQHERARDLCDSARVYMAAEDREYFGLYVTVEIQLAMAWAGLGEFERATEHLTSLLDTRKEGNNPLNLGTLHNALARVALMAGDGKAFDHHVAEVERCFTPTENPALIAQATTLAEQGNKVKNRTDGYTEAFNTAVLSHVAASHALQVALSQCAGPAERAARALELLVGTTDAVDGFLFLTTKDAGLRLAAPLHGDPPPPEVEEDLRRAVADVAAEDAETAVVSTDDIATEAAPTDLFAGYRRLLLQTRIDGDLVVVGAVALRSDGNRFVQPHYEYLDVVARGLFASGDAVTVYEELG